MPRERDKFVKTVYLALFGMWYPRDIEVFVLCPGLQAKIKQGAYTRQSYTPNKKKEKKNILLVGFFPQLENTI